MSSSSKAPSLTGTFTTTRSGNWMGIGGQFEAPIWIDGLPGQGLCIAVDNRGAGYYPHLQRRGLP